MKTLLILMLCAVTLSAQRNPDQKLNLDTADKVNQILLKAEQAITGTGTANQIAYFTGTNTIASLSTATYPSLVELSRLKGVTSPIQAQLNGKQATLISGTNIKTLNGQSLLGNGNITVSGTSDTTGFYVKVYGIVKSILGSQTTNINVQTLDSMRTDYWKNNFLRLNR